LEIGKFNLQENYCLTMDIQGDQFQATDPSDGSVKGYCQYFKPKTNDY
jgi:hypothetical protein